MIFNIKYNKLIQLDVASQVNGSLGGPPCRRGEPSPPPGPTNRDTTQPDPHRAVGRVGRQGRLAEIDPTGRRRLAGRAPGAGPRRGRRVDMAARLGPGGSVPGRDRWPRAANKKPDP